MMTFLFCTSLAKNGYSINRIELQTAQLNAAPAHHLWALADSALLQSIARDEPVQRGPRGQSLARLLRAADRVGLGRALVSLTGLVELLKLLRRQRVAARQAGNPWPERFFVGFGAGPEEALFVRYTAEHAMPPARLNQIDAATFGVWQRLRLIAAMRALWAAQRAAWQAVSELPEPLQHRRLEFLTFAAMRLGLYSYMRAWFQQLRNRRTAPEEVCFLSPDTPAFAAVDAGLPTRYLQHGLVRHSLILPGFELIDTLTRDEMRHFQRRLPRTRVSLESYPQIGPDGLSGGILIASIYGEPDELALIEPVLNWAVAQRCTLWVRPHPCEDHGFWGQFRETHRIRIEDTDRSFEAALQRLRPSLVVSWFSTALADALQCGIIPVTVNDATSPNVQDLVYPLLDRALQWPTDRVEVTQVLNDAGDYHQTLQRLQGN